MRERLNNEKQIPENERKGNVEASVKACSETVVTSVVTLLDGLAAQCIYGTVRLCSNLKRVIRMDLV